MPCVGAVTGTVQLYLIGSSLSMESQKIGVDPLLHCNALGGWSYKVVAGFEAPNMKILCMQSNVKGQKR